METLKFSPQLEALQHQWRNFPILKDSVLKAKDILDKPNDDLSSLSVFYELNPEEGKAWHLHTFLIVNFHLSDESLPKSSQFGQSVIIVRSMVDESGEIIPNKSTDKFQIVTKTGLFGTRLEPGSFLKVPEYVKAKKGF